MPNDIPRDADAERLDSIRKQLSRSVSNDDDWLLSIGAAKFLLRQINSRDAAMCEANAEIVRLETAAEAARKLLNLPRVVSNEELGGESYSFRYIQIESSLREALAAYDAAEPDGWRPIDDQPSIPMSVELYFGNYPSEVDSKDEPYRDSRRRIAYFDGNAFRDTGTGHEVFESWWMTADMRPTQWRPLPPPPAASQEGER